MIREHERIVLTSDLTQVASDQATWAPLFTSMRMVRLLRLNSLLSMEKPPL